MSVTKRRRQAINRRGWVSDLRRRWDSRLGRIPTNATAVSICSCGGKAWTTGDSGSVEAKEFFANFDAVHAGCEVTA